ncbi:MAG: serine/threonine-protein kinase, partial [Bacteroidota bacterium]
EHTHLVPFCMDPRRWKKIKTTFEEVVAKPEAERTSSLNETYAHDTDLRTEVESLLEYHTKADRFLEPPDQPLLGQLDPYIGKHFGAYRIEEIMGHGGMGAVYRAIRDDGQFQKQVAIKLVRPGAWSNELIARFHEERRTLARLEHPNIAGLLDGGAMENGTPCLVLEYVNGKPIDEYCDAAKLPIADRLKLFCTVCSAVQYAHQNLIVHRDVKPSNILVTPDGIPKLLDFGIAKPLSDDEHTEPGDMTKVGLKFVTLEYSSPEQIRGETITTASDVYSLGVLLYKLLTGRSPYQIKNWLPHEITRAVCEQEPLKPSTSPVKSEERNGTSVQTLNELCSLRSDHARETPSSPLGRHRYDSSQGASKRPAQTIRLCRSVCRRYSAIPDRTACCRATRYADLSDC